MKRLSLAVVVLGLSWLSSCSDDNSRSDESSTSEPSTDPTSASLQSTTSDSSSSTSVSTPDIGDTTSANSTTTPQSGAFEVETLWENLTYPCSLRSSGDHIYTCDRRQYLGESSAVLALPKGGGVPDIIAELDHADSVAVNDVVWVLDSGDNSIIRLNPTNGDTLSTFDAPYYTSGLFASTNGAFATSYEGITWFGSNASGGTPVWSAGSEEEVWLLDFDTHAIYLTVNPPYPAERGSSYRVLQIELDFTTGAPLGDPVQLANGVGSAKGITVTSSGVFFADNHSDELHAVKGGVRQLMAELPYPWSLDANSTHVYIASRPEQCTSEGAIYRVPLAGGTLETIATGQVCPSNIVASDSEVYWLNAGPEQPTGEPRMVSGSYAAILRVAL